MFYDFIFPQYCKGRVISLLILALRVFFGILFFTHGLDKMINFNELSYSFPSIFGLGSYMSLMIAIFTEFACSLFLISGLLVRLMTIPMIIAMGVAFFDVHDAMMPEGELALIYFVIFIMFFLTGPGRYSIDYLIDKRFQKDKQTVE